ncbi:unnamed protein product [Wickerhamomyces anomalus]
MSRASKITLATTIVATTVTVIWVHKVQEEERNVSPIKDAQRVQEKALKKKLLANQKEHELQQELRKKYEQLQPLSGVTHTAEEPIKKD